MAYTRKQIVTCISVVYLLVITAVAGYASSRVNKLSVPMPLSLSGFTTALPIIAGLLLEIGYDITRAQEKQRKQPRGTTQRPPSVIVANTLIFIYSTVVMTLLGTYVAPPTELNCRLERKWYDLFRRKNSEAIRQIQDTFSCCGFVNSHDKAWPFPDKSHSVHSCEEAYGRTRGCLGPWKGEQQRMAGLLMGMVGLVFLWQFLIITIPTQRESWLHRVVPNSVSQAIADEEHQGPRRAIDYLPNFNRYSDNTAEEVDGENGEPAPRQTIENGVQQVGDTINGAGNSRNQHQEVENEWARR